MRHLFLFVFLSIASCATDKAAQVREERPYTVGWLGAAFRPNEKHGISLGGSISSDGGAVGLGTLNFLDYTSHNMEWEGKHINVGWMYFPFQTSAFMLGLSAKYGQGKVSFDEDRLSDASKKGRVTYNRTQTYIGIPLGWYWIWENGFTLAIDFGPSIRVQNSTSFEDNGDNDINTTQRDTFRDKIERSGAFRISGGTGIIGYSF